MGATLVSKQTSETALMPTSLDDRLPVVTIKLTDMDDDRSNVLPLTDTSTNLLHVSSQLDSIIQEQSFAVHR
jgi:hypothetical protein